MTKKTNMLDFHLQIMLQLCFGLLQCLLVHHPNEVASQVFLLSSFLQLVCVLLSVFVSFQQYMMIINVKCRSTFHTRMQIYRIAWNLNRIVTPSVVLYTHFPGTPFTMNMVRVIDFSNASSTNRIVL